MTARAFREPGKPPPAEPVKKWPRLPQPRPPSRNVVERLVKRAIAAAEAKDEGAAP